MGSVQENSIWKERASIVSLNCMIIILYSKMSNKHMSNMRSSQQFLWTFVYWINIEWYQFEHFAAAAADTGAVEGFYFVAGEIGGDVSEHFEADVEVVTGKEDLGHDVAGAAIVLDRGLEAEVVEAVENYAIKAINR